MFVVIFNVEDDVVGVVKVIKTVVNKDFEANPGEADLTVENDVPSDDFGVESCVDVADDVGNAEIGIFEDVGALVSSKIQI